MTNPSPVEFVTAFEGANPARNEDIVQTGDGAFVVYPYCEDDSTAYKFRLEVLIVNRQSEPRKIRLVIDWRTCDYNELRDCIYTRSGNGPWEMLDAEISGTRSNIVLDLLPGENWVALNPRYSIEDLNTLLNRTDRMTSVGRQTIGQTAGGRPLWMMTAGSGPKRILISARVHPYETAPSYIVDGIIDSLSSRYKLNEVVKYTYYLLPMVSPDGVAQGLCRLSAKQNGVDLSREIVINDSLTRIYLDRIDTIRPHFYLELHNWMFKDTDGMFYLNGWDARRFQMAIDKHTPPSFRKKWRVGLKFGIWAIAQGGLKRYAQEKYGSKVATLEIPWYQRSVDEMRRFGTSLVKAIETLL